MKKLKFKPEDFEGRYTSNTDCPIARATKRELGYSRPSIGGASVGDSYGILYEYWVYSVYLNEERIAQGGFDDISCDKIKESVQNNTFQSAYVTLK